MAFRAIGGVVGDRAILRVCQQYLVSLSVAGAADWGRSRTVTETGEKIVAVRERKLTHPGKVPRGEFMESLGVSAYAPCGRGTASSAILPYAANVTLAALWKIR
jgi:hypothetical protein